MRKTIIAIVCFVMCISILACTSNNNNPTPVPKETPTVAPTEAPTNTPEPVITIVKEWQTTINLMDALSEADFPAYDGEPINISIGYKFNEDGTYVRIADKESYMTAMDKYVDILLAFLKQMAVMGVEDGEEITDEKLCEVLEIESFDAFKQQTKDELVEEIVWEYNGTYTFENNVLSFYNIDDETVAQVFNVSLTENSLSLNEITTQNDNADMIMTISDGMLPLVFYSK